MQQVLNERFVECINKYMHNWVGINLRIDPGLCWVIMNFLLINFVGWGRLGFLRSQKQGHTQRGLKPFYPMGHTVARRAVLCIH